MLPQVPVAAAPSSRRQEVCMRSVVGGDRPDSSKEASVVGGSSRVGNTTRHHHDRPVRPLQKRHASIVGRRHKVEQLSGLSVTNGAVIAVRNRKI